MNASGGAVTDVGTEAPAAREGSSGPAAWWARSGPFARVVVVAVTLVVGINLLLVGLDTVVGRDPGGPSGSSYATADNGVAAWADLLRLRSVPTSALERPLGEAGLDPGATLVVVDPPSEPDASARRAVNRFVAGGGRLVAVGRGATDHVVAATGADPGWSDGGPRSPRRAAGADGTWVVDRLAAEGRGRFLTATAFTPLVGPEGAPTVVRRGRVTAVADPSILWNRNLDRADNAALALALSGSGPVVFAEAEHGYGEAEGLSALPVRWRTAAAALAAVALVAMWSWGRRLGPPEHRDRPRAPARRAYVDAVAAALSRTGADPVDNHRRTP